MYEKMYESKPKILITKNPPKWMKETLDAFNIDEKRRIEKSDGDVKTKDAIIGNHNMGIGGKNNTFDLSEKDTRHVKQKVKIWQKKLPKLDKKIYVSRQKSRRKLKNFEELK
jgi:capsular polysaccharide biosynthesis protein